MKASQKKHQEEEQRRLAEEERQRAQKEKELAEAREKILREASEGAAVSSLVNAQKTLKEIIGDFAEGEIFPFDVSNIEIIFRPFAHGVFHGDISKWILYQRDEP